ncbi:mechanosensitive ion channel [Pseudenhygromyxa sp. WMMC2535]|uniref:mechanosensitive ion channel domain-containing protein n=1 Tax=Pseudenhygromyxa sp. WMMC2535 TaxID=2712867 RepID=UPI001556CD30|nr:mechanosensitive ion channel domain-containing protein [Pseudenhygromyxa sp. WMMC2535]NVB40249.1 mechanosensitive ion channel [Pseudenhygromyxa sp. WMMC2535]
MSPLRLALAPAPEPAALEASAHGLGARLEAELDALLTLSPTGFAITVIVVLALAWALARLGPLALRTAWRLGIDPRHRLAILGSFARLAGLLLGIAGCLRPILSRAPTLGGLLALLTAALIAAAAPTLLRNLGAGLGLMTRARLREGDLVEVGDIQGTVLDVGLLRVSLRSAGGGVTHVPAADFDRLPVIVGSRRAAAPIEIQAEVDHGLDDAELERLRRALWCSPFRRAGTEPSVRVDASGTRLELSLDTWAPQAGVEIEQHLRALVGHSARREQDPPPPSQLIEEVRA